MQTMAEVVLRQLVVLAVHGQMSLVYSVGVSAHRRTIVARTVHRVGILPDVVVAENHIRRLAVLVGHAERYHAAAEVRDADLHAVGVLQRVELHGFFVYRRVKGCRVKTGYGQFCIIALHA